MCTRVDEQDQFEQREATYLDLGEITWIGPTLLQTGLGYDNVSNSALACLLSGWISVSNRETCIHISSELPKMPSVISVKALNPEPSPNLGAATFHGYSSAIDGHSWRSVYPGTFPGPSQT